MNALLKFSKSKMFAFIAYTFGYAIPVILFGNTIFMNTQLIYYIVMFILLPFSFEFCRKMELI